MGRSGVDMWLSHGDGSSIHGRGDVNTEISRREVFVKDTACQSVT